MELYEQTTPGSLSCVADAKGAWVFTGTRSPHHAWASDHVRAAVCRGQICLVLGGDGKGSPFLLVLVSGRVGWMHWAVLARSDKILAGCAGGM